MCVCVCLCMGMGGGGWRILLNSMLGYGCLRSVIVSMCIESLSFLYVPVILRWILWWLLHVSKLCWLCVLVHVYELVLKFYITCSLEDNFGVYFIRIFVTIFHMASVVFCIFRVPGSLSLSAAMFASVCLASRLHTTWHAFATVTFSFQLFALWPVLRRRLQVCVVSASLYTDICPISLGQKLCVCVCVCVCVCAPACVCMHVYCNILLTPCSPRLARK